MYESFSYVQIPRCLIYRRILNLRTRERLHRKVYDKAEKINCNGAGFKMFNSVQGQVEDPAPGGKRRHLKPGLLFPIFMQYHAI